jgi:hypothetical protein
MLQRQRSGLRALLLASVLAVTVGGLTGAPTDAAVQPAPGTTGDAFNPLPDVANPTDIASAYDPTRDRYMVVTHSASGVRRLYVGVVDGDGTVVTEPVVIHTDASPDSLGSPITTRLDIDYNPLVDEFLVTYVKANRIFGQRMSPGGAPIGGPTQLSQINSADFRCTANHHDVVVDTDTGDYVLAYAVGMFFATADPCEDLSNRHKTTMARISPTLAVGARTDLPGRFENGNNSWTAIERHPSTGDYLVGRLDTDGGTFTLVDADFGVEASQSIDVRNAEPFSFPTYVHVAVDPTSGKWMAIARGSQRSQTMILDADGSIDVPAAIRFTDAVDDLEAVGDGVFVGSTRGTGRVIQLDLRGEKVSTYTVAADVPDLSDLTHGDGARFLATGANRVGNSNAIAAELVAVPPAVLPLAPARIADTRRSETAVTVDGAFEKIGAVAGGTELVLQVGGRAGVPADATAAMLNVAAAGATRNGFVTAYPCDSERPTTSNLNFAAGAAASAGGFVALSGDGRACLFVSTTVELIIDVNGFVPADASIESIVPERFLETRADAATGTVDGAEFGGGRIPAGVTELPVAGRGSVDDGATAVMVNITAIRPSSGLFITVFPCGSAQPTAANLNAPAGGVVNNLALARIGENGKVCIFASAETDLVVDVSAFAPEVGSLVSINPERFIETRPGQETVDGRDQFGRRTGVDGSFNFVSIAGRSSVPAEARGVMLNVAAIRPSASGFVTVYPCGELPNTASVNYAAGSVVSNAVFVALSDPDGWICVYSSADTDLTVDVVGYTTDG